MNPKYLEETRCREVIEPKLEGAQCCLRPGHSTTDQISPSSKFSKNLGSLDKGFGEFCASTVLTATCYSCWKVCARVSSVK